MFAWTAPAWQGFNKAFTKITCLELQWKLISWKCAWSVLWSIVSGKLLGINHNANYSIFTLCFIYSASVLSSAPLASYPLFMECRHQWYVKSILCQNVFDIPPSPSNKAEEALCSIGRAGDIDMAFWWHYEASLISPYCVVTASNHTSSLAWGAPLNGLIELMHQIYEG